jgi:YVTN family beta-propeller protein
MSMGDGIVDGRLDVRILGPLEVRRGAQALPLGGRRQQAVLACLVVSKASVSTDQIADAIWGETTPPGYQSTLQTYVFHLRETLEPQRVKGAPAQVLITTSHGYALHLQDEDVDARRFEHLVNEGRALVATDPGRASALLAEALALWRGDALADLADIELVSQESSRLDELRQSALESWAEAELALGHHTALAPELGRLVAAYPLREGLHAQRMLALYRDGRQAEALAAFRQLRTTLDEELGVEPGRPVQVLHERILRHDPEVDWRPVPAKASSPTDIHAAPPDASDLTDIPPAPPPEVAARSRRRRWTAVASIGVTVVGLLVWTVLKVARADDVTPVPANVVAALSEHGLDGEAVPVSGAQVALATGADGSLWAVDEGANALLRIDPDTRRVIQTIPDVGGSPQAVAVAGDDVWVTGSDEGVLIRVNAATNREAGRIRVGIQPAAVAATADEVWVANSADNTVQRIDPATDKVGNPIRVGDGPVGLRLDGDVLWVANSRSGTVTRLDTKTGEPIAEDVPVQAGARGLALTDTDLWVANELSQSVSRMDLASGRVFNIPVEDGPSTVVVADDSAWVNNAYSGSVSRIDLVTNQVSRIALGSAPRALEVVDGRVWVSTGAFGNPEHVGGTLVYTYWKFGVGTLDPAGVYQVNEIPLLRHVYDGLVSFRVTGGQASQAIVPDLATSVPRPTDGGRTYLFTIRPGIRYSTGAEVQAADFVLGFRRALVNTHGDPSFFAKVLGASSCDAAIESAELCQLSGVTADNTSRRLTVRLTEPDPDFMAKLTYFVAPAPPGSPLKDVGMHTTIPGTGPYVVSEIRPDGVTLSRNPYFHQWSFAAQPYPYPDEIRANMVASQKQAVEDVVAGRADVTRLDTADLATTSRTADQVYPFRNHNTDWAYLNPRIPPFNDLRARQALNYAVDRRTFVTLYGGPDAAEMSCQLLPRGFPAWRRYCPYQSGPPRGDYVGPDLERAKALVRESGTSTTPITVHAYRKIPLWNAFPDYLAETLRSIGYSDVQVLDIPPEHQAGNLNDAAYAGYQIFTQLGWLADYPSASTFYDYNFSCHQANMSGYCNKAVEAVAVQAAAVAASDPARSLELWAQVDQMLTDDAAFVTLGSHRDAMLVSRRVRNVLTRPGIGAVLSQLWVK